MGFDLGKQLGNLAGDIGKQTGITGALQNLGIISPVTPEVAGNLPSGDNYRARHGILVADAFMNFSTLDGRDYRSVYPYSLVITGLSGQFSSLSLVLPIGPQNISMNVPTATSISVTMKGMIEDNNGAPLRTISISGTTGILSAVSTVNKQSAGKENFGSAVGSYLQKSAIDAFSNSIQSVNNAISTVGRAVNAITGSKQEGPLNISQPTITDGQAEAWLHNTGYWFFHQLQRGLETYLSAKKTRAGKDVRLTFLMHKDKMYWDVILNGYSFTKQAGTLEYMYNINLTAYRRRETMGTKPSVLAFAVTGSEALPAFKAAMAAFRASRSVVSKALNVVKGFNADIAAFTNAVKEIQAAFSNEAPTVANIISPSAVTAVKQSMISMATGDSQTATQFRDNLKQAGFTGVSSLPGSSGMDPLAYTKNLSDGKAAQAVRPETAHAVEKIFKNPDAYYDVLSAINIDSLDLSREASRVLQDEVVAAKSIDIAGWKLRREQMMQTYHTVQMALGGGSATYNRIQDLPAPPTTLRSLTVADMELLNAMNDSIMGYDKVINLLQQEGPNQANDYFQFYSSYATSNGIAVPQSNSKFYVPFPYGASLESLAVQYLGDVNRWHEIAAINALKEPYTDETGFDLLFTSNGSNSTAIVANANSLYINEVVEIRSDTQATTFRKITGIEKLSSVETILTFDGNVSLSPYKVINNAAVHAYAPNTVNSTKLIAIPAVGPVNVPGKIQLAPGIQDLDKIAQIAKVDFLMQSDGDLVFAGNDIRLSSGLTNLVQAITIRLQTRQGDLLQFPDYGNPLQAGDATADINLQDMANSLSQQFSADGRFGGIVLGRYAIKGPAASIDLLFNVANTGVNLPISTNLPV